MKNNIVWFHLYKIFRIWVIENRLVITGGGIGVGMDFFWGDENVLLEINNGGDCTVL